MPALSAPADIKSYYTDDVMKNACSKGELSRLRNAVILLSKARAPTRAWKLTKEMLCGVTPQSVKYVRANTAMSIAHEDNTETPDGQSALNTMDRGSLALIKGQAWEATIVSENELIRVLYDMGGVCTGSFDIHYVKHGWEIVADGIYCD